MFTQQQFSAISTGLLDKQYGLPGVYKFNIH